MGKTQWCILRHHARRGRLAGTVAGEIDRYRGDYPYLNRALFPPEESPREGGDQQKHSIFGSMTWTRPNEEWRVSAWYNDAERGLPSINSSLHSGERQWDEHLRVWTHVRRKWPWGSLKAGGLTQVGVTPLHESTYRILITLVERPYHLSMPILI